MCAEIAAATSAPPATARLPPSQKSFWTSTTISARVMAGLLSLGHGLQHRFAAGERPRLGRQRRPHLLVVRPGLPQRLGGAEVGGDGAAPDQRDDEVPVAVPGCDRLAADDLGEGRAVAGGPANGAVAGAPGGLSPRLLGPPNPRAPAGP